MSIDPTSLPDAPRAGGETSIESLFAFASRAYVLLDNVTDDDECERDHHGNCQTHLGERECSVAAARKLLDEYSDALDEAEAALPSLLARQRDGERAQASHVIDTRFINDVRRLYNTTTGVYEFRAAVGECIGNLNEARAKLPPLDGPRIVPSAPSAERA